MMCTATALYKALLPPRCNGRSGCVACTAKWQEAQARRIKAAAVIREQQRAAKKAAREASKAGDVDWTDAPF